MQLREGGARVEDQQPEGPIELSMPADRRLIRIVRLVGSAVATAAGFDLDEIDDVRIGVHEACTALLEAGDGSAIVVRFDLGVGEVAMEGRTGAGGQSFEPNRLQMSREILGVVVDSYEIVAGDDSVEMRLRKRRAASTIDG